MRRPAPHELNQAVDRARLTLEDRLDSTVTTVAHPPVNAGVNRFPPHRVPEEDALHTPINDHAPAYPLARHCMDSCSGAVPSAPSAILRSPP